MNKIIIAIDGYSSCGKSTLAKQLAQKLNYIYIDSGAMYRAITLYFIQNNIDLKDIFTIINAIKNIEIEFKLVNNSQHIFLNGKDVEKEIRNIEVAKHVSEVATIKEVRDFAVAQQQNYGLQKGIVMDGRDIGTTVFPNAELKLFMTASIDIRTQRRFDETEEENISFETVKNNLIERDRIDSTREISPLTQASDAIVLDNSKLTQEEQLELALGLVKKKVEL